MQKKSIIFIFFICFLFNSNICYGKNINYLALGDSIAYGHNLEDISNEAYSQIIKKSIGVQESEYSNLAISGETCKDYFDKIQESEYSEKIKNANLITISIGSNEILNIATEGIEAVSGVKAEEEDFFGKVQKSFNEASIGKRYEMVKELYDYFNSEECNNKMNYNISVYKEYWCKTIQYIKSINPTVTIVATEFYNPYYGIKIGNYDIGEFSDKPIKKMNEILWKNSNGEKEYKIAKIYDGFNNNEIKMTNAEINTSVTKFQINMDPHPNKNGHKMIAEKIMETLFETESLNEINIEKTIMNQEKKSANYEEKGHSLIFIITLSIFIPILIYFYYKKT